MRSSARPRAARAPLARRKAEREGESSASGQQAQAGCHEREVDHVEKRTLERKAPRDEPLQVGARERPRRRADQRRAACERHREGSTERARRADGEQTATRDGQRRMFAGRASSDNDSGS